MGLYESEISKQMYLRNKQKREWEVMKKKIALDKELSQKSLIEQQQVYDQERREEDRLEIRETETSKKLALAMLKSANENSDDTLQRAVELLHNQNGNARLFFLDFCI